MKARELNSRCRLASVALPAILAVTAALCGCSRKSTAAETAAAPTPVKLLLAQSAKVPLTSEYLAVLKSRHSATISPQVDGQVTHILVASGDKVAAGTPLMQIDPLKQQATVGSQEATRASKQAALLYAKIQFERTKKLYDAGVTSKQSLDESQLALDSAEAELKALDAQVREQQVQLRYYRVVAPMNGIVGDIPVRVGDRVTSSTVLTTVDQPGELEAYISVPVERSKELHVGAAVEFLDAAGAPVARSRVSFISPQVDPDTQSVLAKAQVDNRQGKLRTAEIKRARITWGEHQGPVIPVLAVSRINGRYFAFVAEGDAKSLVARQKMLRVGDLVGNDYVVLEGIKVGDRVVVSGTQNLTDGTPVAEAAKDPRGAPQP